VQFYSECINEAKLLADYLKQAVREVTGVFRTVGKLEKTETAVKKPGQCDEASKTTSDDARI
jgi:hypothetical protein